MNENARKTGIFLMVVSVLGLAGWLAGTGMKAPQEVSSRAYVSHGTDAELSGRGVR